MGAVFTLNYCKHQHVGGFSMGSALAIYAGLTYEHTLGGIVSLSGFLLQRGKIPGEHKANLNTPIFLGHGQNDFLVPYTFGQMTEQALKKFNSNVTFHTYPIDHSSSPNELRDAVDFIKANIKG
jgi:predicted esterase